MLAPLASHVGLVHFDWPIKGTVIVAVVECLANALEHVPGGFLRDPDLQVQLHAGDALEAGQVQVDGVHPLAERQLRILQQRTGLDAEVGPAVRAPVGHLGM